MLRKLFFSCFCMLFIAGMASAQQKKIIPTKGEVVFASQNVVLDEALYTASTKALQQKMISFLKTKFTLEASKEIDTSTFYQFINQMPMLADVLKQTKDKNSYHVYENNFIKSFESSDGTVPNTFFYIDQNSANYVIRNEVLGGDSSESDAIAYEYQQNKDVIIKEFREQQKKINGYNCFKVTYQYKDTFEDEELKPVLATNEYNVTEFWVTEEIQSKFHPLCRIREILAKYYPLEISEQFAMIKGFTTIHRLKSITLSN